MRIVHRTRLSTSQRHRKTDIKMGSNKRGLNDDDSDMDSDVSMTDTEDDDGSDSEDSPTDDTAPIPDEPEDENEDEVIRAIKAEKAKKRDNPPAITTEDSIVDICMHPARDLVAVATMAGDVLLYQYSNEECKLLETHELHTRACRDVEFDAEGALMFTTAKDKSVMVTDTASGKLKQCYEDVHDDPVYCLRCLDENKFVTGDDGGVVKLWDLRKPEAVCSVRVGEETVSDMLTTDARKHLVCAGADGVLTAIDLRACKIYSSSEDYDSELTCLGLFRSDTKLLVGSARGKLYLFNWKQFGLHSDEYIGHKESVACMVPITQNIVVTAGEDGVLRAAHMFPHRQLGVVGQHLMPVDRLDISRDGRLLASSSHDNDVKFWNVSYFENLENVIDVTQKQNKKKDMVNNLPSSHMKNASDFFSGLA